MTAAGTIQPAKVVIMGAGVAGLKAFATARRLGAVMINKRILKISRNVRRLYGRRRVGSRISCGK